MKIKSILLKPGTILCWSEYNIFTRLWNKLKGKELANNRFTILPYKSELLTIDNFHVIAYEPIRKYNKQELSKLNSIYCIEEENNWSTVSYIINLIRPNTFTNTDTIENCKYYKKRNLNAESTEYIY